MIDRSGFISSCPEDCPDYDPAAATAEPNTSNAHNALEALKKEEP